MTEDEHIAFLIDRYSPDELCEVLKLTSEMLVDAFYEKCLEIEIDYR